MPAPTGIGFLAYEDAKANAELRHRACFLVRGNAAFAGFKAAGIRGRLRRRMAARGRRQICRGRVRVRADDAHEHSLCRTADDHGILTMTQQEIDERRRGCAPAQLPVAIHANGDVTIDMVLKRLRTRALQIAAKRPATSDRALLSGQPRPASPHQGDRSHSHALLHLRPLPRRQMGGVRP